ncbi:putative+protein [Methylocapsa aurea]|jgi:very-short-patch-repair endonuclease|uniref:endonuclease domain-containing protein n=1 Tax=Methylocapsa aurea TaxID=663610 RepID=UPI003D1883E4
MPTRVSKSKTAFARRLRREMTNAEEILWRSLRNSGLDGLKFRRQVPIGNYVADFLSTEHRLIVELDGRPHEQDDQRRHDAIRDKWLRDNGYQILRLANDLVIGGGNIPLEWIREAIANRRGPSSDPAPPGHLLPQVGEGRTRRS